ncbi:RNA-guided endonuclease InsQ/TnpB family protein [Floridanema evergladense]|uniref:RNA-guided endonuclease InsQ/TnpB family protein n=1 Tax=Floridaenema evergladense BLCC-F167 TaxID=3153639 RepID=A0ABV4WQ38_9CYAN
MYAIKRELKLNNKETSLMRGMAGFRRFVYNFGLEMLVASWSFEGINLGDSKRIDSIKQVFTQVIMKMAEYAWTKQYPSTVYQSAFIDLKKAFKRWRQGLSGFPKKKTKKKGDSFTVYKTSGIYPEKGKPPIPFTNRVVIKAGKRIQLPGLREFRLKEKIGFTCSSQTFTVTRTADKWFVSFALDASKVPPIYHPIERVGVDLGVKTLATVSDGTCYAMPETNKKAKTKLKLLQWRNRNKVLGSKKLGVKASKNALDYYIKVARHHARISNIRRDTTQKMTTDLSRRAYCIRIEDLNVSGMMATKVELVDRWFPSSKTCSICGHIQEMKLSDRVFDCQKCDNVMDRDLNASTNLENAPEEKVRSARPELNACGQVGADTLG